MTYDFLHETGKKRRHACHVGAPTCGSVQERDGRERTPDGARPRRPTLHRGFGKSRRAQQLVFRGWKPKHSRGRYTHGPDLARPTIRRTAPARQVGAITRGNLRSSRKIWPFGHPAAGESRRLRRRSMHGLKSGALPCRCTAAGESQPLPGPSACRRGDFPRPEIRDP